MSGRQPWVSAQKVHNIWSDRWIALKFLQGFTESIFIGVAMEWLLRDEDVWSVELEYRLKKAITFDPTVGSRSNFYKGFQRLFVLGKLWNCCWVTRMSGRQPWVSVQKDHNVWSDRWIALKFLQWFPEAIFLGVLTEWLLGDEYVWRSNFRIGSKEPSILLWPLVTLKFLQGFPEAVFRGVDMEWLLGDEDVWSVELEYLLKRAITFDPIVGSR